MRKNFILERSQLLLGLLDAVHDAGGSMPASDAIDKIADRFDVPQEVRNDYQEVDCGKWGIRKRCAFRQTVHWARMDAVSAGLMVKNEYGIWTLTDKGHEVRQHAKPGLILVVYETPNGEVCWADAITAAGAFKNNSLQLVFSSMPYPILTGRSYGLFTEAELIELTVKCAREWTRALRDDGSICLNFRDCWQRGEPTRSLYQERLLLALVDDVKLKFADRFIWRNPSHTPESPWVTVKKVRTNLDFETIFWLSKTAHPKADVRRVMVDAKPSTVATYLRRAARGVRGTTVGPSGQKNNFEEQMAMVAAGQTLKVIPRNCLDFSNANNHTKLRDALAAAGLPRHDASMPRKLCEFFVKFLSEKGDHCVDGFFGSGVFGEVCEDLGRRWTGSDRDLGFLLGSALRFDQSQVNYGPAVDSLAMQTA